MGDGAGPTGLERSGGSSEATAAGTWATTAAASRTDGACRDLAVDVLRLAMRAAKALVGLRHAPQLFVEPSAVLTSVLVHWHG